MCLSLSGKQQIVNYVKNIWFNWYHKADWFCFSNRYTAVTVNGVTFSWTAVVSGEHQNSALSTKTFLSCTSVQNIFLYAMHSLAMHVILTCCYCFPSVAFFCSFHCLQFLINWCGTLLACILSLYLCLCLCGHIQIQMSGSKSVTKATCCCPRGQLKCHHMVALLIYGHRNISCTDISCQWKVCCFLH